MQPPHHRPRINLADLKALMVKKLGPEGSKQYFSFLNMFLSLKLTKVEFNKHCLRIVGRENIPLHNHLIHSILRNACRAKVAPPVSYKDDGLKHSTKVRSKDVSANGFQQNGSHNGMSLLNGGDVLPLSPRKPRTGLRDRRTGDRRSALGSNGTTSFAPQSNDVKVVLENGDSQVLEIARSVQHHQGLLRQSESESEKVVSQVANMSGTDRRSHIGSVLDQTELVVRDDGKEGYPRSPLRAPLGVQFIDQACGALPPASSCRLTGSLNDVALLDSLTLRERMEQIAVAQGLEGVSVDSANVLNHGLDSYIKGLIRSCIELVELRSENELTKSNLNKPHNNMKLINGFRPSHQHWMQSSGKSLEVPDQKTRCPILLQDFRVSIGLNPQKLGKDWPWLLERICTHVFEE